MDKGWMTLGKTTNGRISPQYFQGVDSFINFAKAVVDKNGKIQCPCVNCLNIYRQTLGVVQVHLLQRGIMQTYTKWYEHGEPRVSNNTHCNEMSNTDHTCGIDDLVEDRVRGQHIDMAQDKAQEEEVRNFDKLLDDAKREVYPGCKDYTLLKFVIEMMNVKVMTNLTNKGLDMILDLLIKLLPKGNLVPRSTYEAKIFLRDLGLSYEHIHACKNDCVLFWKENANLVECPVCKESRYKVNHASGMKIAHKVLRYFPLTPRLRRLYMSRKRAEDMRWYRDKRVDDGISRHPADSEEWKEFDLQHPEFALEPRNVRLGLATDGFNPFGNMNNSYSMWPVILIPYNLPPWLVMKEPFFMLSLLIPGPHQPGNDIDVYLRPLVDELKELWQDGALAYDASSSMTFQMHAALLWTIHDYPGFGNVSGWRTKGYHACYTCNDKPYSESLESKIGYTNHRGYLPVDHPWRKSRAFNGKIEKRKRSLELPVQTIQEQLEKMPGITLGKNPNGKRPRELIGEPNWKKVSILYELPYWMNKKLRHNIDVMHVEKNISESTFGTMLGIDGKNKDTDKARMDLKKMNIRQDLHLKERPDGSYVKPQAIFSLTPKERDGFYEFLKSVKYPDGYAANISRSVNTRNGRLSGLKSHDCHVLLQRVLPIGMRGFVDKDISTILFELGSFFQDLCSRSLRRSDLENLEDRIVLILCKLEKFFPPAFFDVMVHLAVHLPREAILGGPVQYRWMYPIERFLGTLKGYVSNRARPEGSIAEAYILKECITFCSLYLDGIETVHNRKERNEDCGECSTGLTINKLRVEGSLEATDQLWSLANGPNLLVKKYSACIVNGVRFHTRDLDNRRISQNSGVSAEGDHEGQRHDFYGHLGNIWEFEYMLHNKVVLFQCEWRSKFSIFLIPKQVNLGKLCNASNIGECLMYQRLVMKNLMIIWKLMMHFNAFQQETITNVVPIDIQDNVQYCRDDVEPEVIREDEIMAEHRDDDENEEHDIVDDDLDPDMDYDILARIKDNQEKMKALGLKQMTSVMRQSSLLKHANAKLKRVTVEIDDDDYVPSLSGDDNADESSSSSMHEDIEMLDHGGDSLAPHILERDSPTPQIHGEVVLSTDTPSSSAVVSTSKRTRGLTRGIGVQTLVDKEGKLSVPFPQDYCAPVGKNACKLSSQLGVLVRTSMADLNVCRWSKVPDSIKQPIMQRIEDQFDLQGEAEKINKSLNTSAGRRLGDFKTKLRIKYKAIVKEKGKDYARSHPPSICSPEQWIGLIDGIWSDEDWLEEIIRVQEEHLSDPNTIPLTPEEVSVRILKPRSGYVKGLGMRPSSSLKIMSSSTSNAYVRQLEECIVELQEANRRQEEERKKEKEEREKEKEERIKYEKATSSIIEFLRGKGFTGAEPFGNGGSSSSG
uniref:Transposase-associated domain-containing protein n=1 Tax=Fagus sylvatica TaxID=28930 RepID=A0A2N9GCW6_FAGSY